MSVVEIAADVRAGRRRAIDVVEEHLARIAARDGEIHAFLHVDADGARSAARAVDDTVARGEDPDGDAASLDVLATLQKFPQARPHAEAVGGDVSRRQMRPFHVSDAQRSEQFGAREEIERLACGFTQQGREDRRRTGAVVPHRPRRSRPRQ